MRNKLAVALVLGLSIFPLSLMAQDAKAPVVEQKPSLPTKEDREKYAQELQENHLKARESAKLDSGGLKVTVEGSIGEILVVCDDADDLAIRWLIVLHENEGQRNFLLDKGFKIFVLRNKVHGTFVVDLRSGDVLKAEGA